MVHTRDFVPEKTLFDVLRDIWRAKFYMLFFCCLFIFLSFVFLGFSNSYYRAEMVLAPAMPMGQGRAAQRQEGTIQVQVSDLQSDVVFLRFEATYSGVSVANILMKDQNVLDVLAFDRPFVFSDAPNAKHAEGLSEYLKARVLLEPVSGTSLRRLVYLHPNKDFAKAMIARIHRITDEMIRVRFLHAVNERIDYLNSALSRTQNPDHRRSLVLLLMEQERLKMLVSLDQPFAASIVEPPSVSAKPRWPDPYLIYPVFMFVGLLIGFVVHGIRHHEK